jgi:signal transduction histidine kinase
MRSPQSLVLRPAARGSGGPVTGPAMTVLGTTVGRVVVVVRAIALAEIAVQVIIWRSFYLAGPWLLAGPVAALAWGGTTMAYLRHRRPGWQFVCMDTAVCTGLALGAAWCVPAAIRGEAASWLFILVITQALTPVWFAPRALSVPLAVVPGIAFGVGTVLAPAAGLAAAGPRRASLALLFVVVAMHWLGRRALCGRAAQADAALAAADTEARDQYVILSGNLERREQDRLMHDTILNTLTAVARSGGSTAAISQCRQDIALLQGALSDSGITADPGGPGSGPVAAVGAVVDEMRARGLAVGLEVEGGAAQGSPEPGLVPAPVAAALAHATREALANVAEHAGTGQAWVTVSMTAPAGPGTAGRIQVTVRDAGAGFDPGQVGPARLGVRRSISERVEDRGGSASVRSAPGEGTTVSLCWPADGTDAVPVGWPAAGAAGRMEPGQW